MNERAVWNQGQQALRAALAKPGQHGLAVDLFLKQHAMVHSAQMAETGLHSFQDELLDRLTESQLRAIPKNSKNSIVWSLWHCARIEDITMSILVMDEPQLLHSEGWYERMGVSARDTGNAMDEQAVLALSDEMNVDELLNYKSAVGRRTRDRVLSLPPERLHKKTEPARLQRVSEEGAVDEAASWLLDYWGGHKVSGLLLMPVTRHHFVHLNKSSRSL